MKKIPVWMVVIMGAALFLAGCNVFRGGIVEGELLDDTQGAAVLAAAIAANAEIESFTSEITQTMEASFDGERQSFTNKMEIQAVDESAWIKMDVESDGTSVSEEVIALEGTLYRRRDESDWQIEDQYTEEELSASEEFSYDYLEALQELDIAFDVYETDEVYRFHAETAGETAEELVRLLDADSEMVEEDFSNELLNLGLSDLSFILDVDKTTYYQTAYSVEVNGENEIEETSVEWNQTMEGIFYDFNETGPIEAPEIAESTAPLFGVDDEGNGGFSAEETEEWVSQTIIDDYMESYSVNATYVLEDRQNDLYYEFEEYGDIHNRRESGHFNIREDLNGEVMTREIIWNRNEEKQFILENEEEWSATLYGLPGLSTNYNQILDRVIWVNRAHFSMREEGDSRILSFEENLEEADPVLKRFKEYMDSRVPFDEWADIDSQLNDEELVMRLNAVINTESKYLQTMTYELKQEELTLTVTIDYDNWNDLEEIVIPEEIEEEAAENG